MTKVFEMIDVAHELMANDGDYSDGDLDGTPGFSLSYIDDYEAQVKMVINRDDEEELFLINIQRVSR